MSEPKGTNTYTEKKAPEGAKHLSEFLSDLPSNVILDKGKTGCGGTTLALTSQKNYIIAVPTIGLVEDKIDWCKKHGYDNVLAVQGEVPGSAIEAFIKEGYEHMKFIATYDSIPRIVAKLHYGSKKPNENFKLLIDEYHMLLLWYGLKPEIMRRTMEYISKFDEFCLMSATPLDPDILLEELRTLDTYKIVWPEETKDETIVMPVICPKPSKGVQQLIINHQKRREKGETAQNLHIFFNSVNGIVKIVSALNLNPDNTKIVCSKTGEEKLPKGFEIGSASSEPKQINFYTSTSFCGRDIYDPEGITVVVSDSNSAVTTIDVCITLRQIAGRIRDSQLGKEVIHLYNYAEPDGFSTYEEYEKHLDEKYKEARKKAKALNRTGKYIKEIYVGLKTSTTFESYYFYMKEQDRKIHVDGNFKILDAFLYKTSKFIYREGNMAEEYEKAGFTKAQTKYMQILADDTKPTRKSFKSLCKEYQEIHYALRQEPDKSDDRKDLIDRIREIRNEEPLVMEAFSELGEEEIERLEYDRKKIKTALVKHSERTQREKIITLLQSRLQYGKDYPVEPLKKMLQEIYDGLGIKLTASATDIKNYCEVRERVGFNRCTPKTENMRKERLFVILKYKQ